MSYKITDMCVSCGICMDECPVGAISKVVEKFIINCDRCTDCGVCADTCPFDAVDAEDERQ
jgi:ferredoxin